MRAALDRSIDQERASGRKGKPTSRPTGEQLRERERESSQARTLVTGEHKALASL